MIKAATDGDELLTCGRRRSSVRIIAPAGGGAVDAERAGVDNPAADGGEFLTRGRRRLTDIVTREPIVAPAYGRAIGAERAGVPNPTADGSEPLVLRWCQAVKVVPPADGRAVGAKCTGVAIAAAN